MTVVQGLWVVTITCSFEKPLCLQHPALATRATVAPLSQTEPYCKATATNGNASRHTGRHAGGIKQMWKTAE